MISCNLNFDLDGKSLGNLDLTYSNNQHAFDKLPIPIAVIKNGNGPTLLLTAGNHGDEYEGQVILRRLIHELDPDEINGRLIILPALNYPAVMDGSRVSPLDQGNLNRSFPGRNDGSPTSAIAHFVSSKLIPLSDAGVDLHSGGSRTYYLPCGFVCTCNDQNIMKQSLELADAFNAPFTFLADGAASQTGFDPAAQNLGVPFISAELAGGANLDVSAVEIGMSGLRNIFQHLGIQKTNRQWTPQTRFLNGVSGACAVSAPYTGIFEPRFGLGDKVSKGQVAGVLYSLEEVEREPLNLVFECSGIVMVRRNGARVQRGSHVYLVVEEFERDQLSRLTGSLN